MQAATLTAFRRARRSWYLLVPALFVAVGVLVPLAYLVLRAFEAEPARLADLVLRARTLQLLANTLLLTAGVLILTTLIAFPLAWLTARADLAGRRFITLLGVLPLAVPGYVMAYALLAVTGNYGMGAQLFGLSLPFASGYWGAMFALGLCTFPYLFLNLRTALLGLDPSLEESARTLGYTRRQVFYRVTLPQLRPAFLSGGLLVSLHVLGDFGVVSLMRYKTFSYALYLQYTASYDRIYAAWLALILLAITTCFLFAEARLLRGLLFHRAGTGVHRAGRRLALGLWRWPAYVFAFVVAGLTALLPISTTLYWLAQEELSMNVTGWAELFQSLWMSVSASAPAALLAVVLALPLAYLSVRRTSRFSRAMERIAYLGYAVPPLAFALALIFFTLRTLTPMYQTLTLLVVAYALHFLAEAIGPLRTTLYQAPPQLEEAARLHGRSPVRAFYEATFPLLRSGALVSIAIVFLSAMKELPLTFLLSPLGFDTLAMNVWSYATEALFAAAAPYALAIIVFSAGFVGLLLMQESETKQPN